jgi:hypothetical protein
MAALPLRATRRNQRTWGNQFVKNLLLEHLGVALQVGFHATRRASVGSIFDVGLLPSSPDRQTTADRLDCEGNIYLCERLGGPSDAGLVGSESADWWRDHLAKNNRFGDPDWVILEVRVGRLLGAQLSRDSWSKSGVIVSGVPAIPPDLIRLIYPDEAVAET